MLYSSADTNTHTNLFLQEFPELPLTVPHAVHISTVHHPNEAVGALKVVTPVRAKGTLASYIPDVELISVRVQGP